MALQLPLRRLGLATRARAALRLRSRALAEGGGSCSGGSVPPCAPCEPAAQPVCRACSPAVRRAQRVVCCPPPRGARPPCPPRDPSCALTCRDAIDQGRTISTRAVEEKDECPAIAKGCGGKTDRVAQRLALAKRARMIDYESEATSAAAAAARPAARAAPAAAYRLGGERECARATDGRLYTMPAHCGPDRTPPPPRCVELEPDDNCRIRGEVHLDPCAHRPRVMIEIDRRQPSATATGTKASSVSNNTTRKTTDTDSELCAPPQRFKSRCSNVKSASTEGLTSRIIKTLSLGGSAGSGVGSGAGSGARSVAASGGGTKCPRASCGGECKGGSARRAGDESWCASPPPAVPAPTRCRRLGLADRLRARSAPPRCPPRCGRELHTSAATGATGATSAGAGNLEKVLRRRSELKEAGRGRVVVDAGAGGSQRAESPGGRLDLSVPPGTERVRVRVSLDGARRGPCAGAGPAPQPPTAAGGGAALATRTSYAGPPATPPAPGSARPDPCRRLSEDGQNSWLSIKNIQKKFSGSRRGSEEGGAAPGPGQASPATRPACPPPRPACPPPRPARPPPCAAPVAPSPPSSACGGRRPKKPEPGSKKCISTILSPDAILPGS